MDGVEKAATPHVEAVKAVTVVLFVVVGSSRGDTTTRRKTTTVHHGDTGIGHSRSILSPILNSFLFSCVCLVC